MKTSFIRTAGVAVFSAAALAFIAQVKAQDQPPPPPPPGNDMPASEAPPAPPPPPQETYAQPQESYAQPAPPPPQVAQPLTSVDLPPGLSRQQVQGAILAALQHRDWRVVSTGHHTVTAHLLHHHVDATLTLSFNEGRVDFYAESYLVGHHAEDRIHEFTREDWINNLKHDIRYYATRGAPQG